MKKLKEKERESIYTYKEVVYDGAKISSVECDGKLTSITIHTGHLGENGHFLPSERPIHIDFNPFENQSDALVEFIKKEIK